jgi:CubicO group peptidase (beta-lactamase class C family)
MHHFVATLVLAFAQLPDDPPATALERAFTTLESLGYSGGLAVVEEGELLLERGFGLADVATGAKVTTDTVFDCGSITKQFTAAAILALEAAGKLAVDDPISEYFENVPPDKTAITIHHLLTHSSGFPGAIGHDHEAIGKDAYLERAFATALGSEPGARYTYSNVGFSLLAMIVEDVSGQPYENYLRERLFTPVGIETAGYVLPKYELASVAKIYDGDNEWGRVFQNHWLEDGPGWHLRGNGGIHLRLADMLRWVAALQDDSVLPAAQREKMFAQQMDEGNGESFYGYGWVIERGPRGKIIHHNGGNMVFSANVRFIPAVERCVFVVSTQKDWNADDLMELAIGILNDDSELRLPAVTPLPRSEIAALAGDYRSADGHHLTVTARGAMLRILARDMATDARLFATTPEARDRYTGLAQRAADFVQAAIDGDYGPLNAATGKRRSIEETGRRFQAQFDQATAAHGEFAKLNVIGTRPFQDGLAVWIELRFARGTEFVGYLFDGDLVVGMIVSERGPSTDLAHVGNHAFESFSLQPDASALRITFKTAPGKRPTITLADGTAFERVAGT